MIAVIKTGGKQYAVKTGQILKVEKLEGEKGDNILLNNVLMLSDTSNHTFGNPTIKGASVEAKILEQIKDKKIIVFKKRKRKNSQSTHGHRQFLTVLKIESIKHDGKKTYAPSKETKKAISKTKILKKEEAKKNEKKIIKKTAPLKKTSTKSIKKKVTTKKTTKTKG